MTTTVETSCPIWCDDCSDLGDGVVLHQSWVRGSRWEIQACIETTPAAARPFIWVGLTGDSEDEYTPDEALQFALDITTAASRLQPRRD